MKRIRIIAIVLVFFLSAPFSQGQGSQTAANKPPIPQESTGEIPLKIQILLTEFDGTRKISSLPYTIDTLGTGWQDREGSRLRYGIRVPIVTSPGNWTYENVGTNIDCTAIRREDAAYRVDLRIERSSVSVPGANGGEWKPGEPAGSQPMVLSFDDDFYVVVKNGQTVEGTSAVDPITGHVLKVTVTLTESK